MVPFILTLFLSPVFANDIPWENLRDELKEVKLQYGKNEAQEVSVTEELTIKEVEDAISTKNAGREKEKKAKTRLRSH